MAHHQHKYGNKIGATLENIPRSALNPDE
jgi:hypothetical protein